jgi:hypothetical protein
MRSVAREPLAPQIIVTDIAASPLRDDTLLQAAVNQPGGLRC